MIDNEMLLFDRLEVINTANNKYDLEKNAYLSFSGGKDSTILHHLLDMALPNNRIPRVFIDTGIEYNAIREFVMNLASKDDRFVIVKPSQPIKRILDEYGYPFKSKEHSTKLHEFQLGHRNTKSIKRYMTCETFQCPKRLLYQFDDSFTLNVSQYCCIKLKKEPAKRWANENHRPVIITGMRKAEGGQRNTLGCIVTDRDGKLKKFHPLAIVSEEWESWFAEREQIRFCELYYPPYNFVRTGCKGCPFALKLQEQLDMMEKYLPKEKAQCEFIWKPVYDEYRRLNYRLKGENK